MQNLENELLELAENNKILLSVISIVIMLAKLFGWTDEKTKNVFKKRLGK